MKLREAWDLLKEVFNEWSEDKAGRLGAALAYYSVFSLAPLVLIAIGIAGLVFGEEAASGGIVHEIEGIAGEPAASAIAGLVKEASQTRASGIAMFVGLALLLIGASGVFVQLQDALNTIWKVQRRPGRPIREMIRDRFLSFTVVLGAGFLLLVSLVISAALSALGKWMAAATLPGGVVLWQVIHAFVSLGVITVLFALIYKLLPDVKIAWRNVWVGALVTALLFTLGKYLIGLYLGQSGASSAFGAAGSLVVILIWVYYSAQILLFGAEFTRVHAQRSGYPIVPADNAIVVTETVRACQGMTRPKQEQVVPLSSTRH